MQGPGAFFNTYAYLLTQTNKNKLHRAYRKNNKTNFYALEQQFIKKYHIPNNLPPLFRVIHGGVNLTKREKSKRVGRNLVRERAYYRGLERLYDPSRLNFHKNKTKKNILKQISLVRNAKSTQTRQNLVNRAKDAINRSAFFLGKDITKNLTENLNAAKTVNVVRILRNIERKISLVRKANSNNINRLVNNTRRAINTNNLNENTKAKYRLNLNNARHRSITTWRRGLTAEQLARQRHAEITVPRFNSSRIYARV